MTNEYKETDVLYSDGKIDMTPVIQGMLDRGEPVVLKGLHRISGTIEIGKNHIIKGET